MTQEEALQLIRSAIVAMSGLQDSQCLIADGDNPRPLRPHVWMRIRTDEAQMFPERVDLASLKQNRLLQIEMEAIGEPAVTGLKMATMRLRLPNDMLGIQLSRDGIGVSSVGNFTNVSALLRTSKEPRETINITFSYVFIAAVPEPVAATAIILDIFGNDTLEYNETFEIP